MRVLFIVKTVDFIDPQGLAELSARAKVIGHETFLGILTREDIFAKIKRIEPDVIAYNAVTGNHREYFELNDTIKKRFKGIFTIMGGPHATFYPECIKDSSLDAICVGEGDEAFKRVVKEVPDVRLLIVGEGRLKGALERKIAGLSLQKNVLLTGFREDIPEILSIADISLHTSLWEGTPLAIIEAMASGKAVIATAVGGIPEMINDGVNGILVHPDDTAELAGRIIRLAKDRQLLAGLGREAEKYIKAKLGSRYVIEAITGLYDSFLTKKLKGK